MCGDPTKRYLQSRRMLAALISTVIFLETGRGWFHYSAAIAHLKRVAVSQSCVTWG